MAKFEPVLLANIDRDDSHTLSVYESTGGYDALKTTLADKSPGDVVELVKSSNLRGRGGAGFPTGVKWTFLPQDHPGPIYMCINADESEPGTFNNRILMEEDPHQIIEGAILSCYATRATTAYIYLRYEYPDCHARLQSAIDECYAAGYLGKNILGTDFSLDMYLHRGAAAYICGEETGLIESLEGKRAWPRIKPPSPPSKACSTSRRSCLRCVSRGPRCRVPGRPAAFRPTASSPRWRSGSGRRAGRSADGPAVPPSPPRPRAWCDASSDSLFASTTVQEVTTTVRGPIHEWRILADGTVLLRMNVTEAKEGLKGTRWLRTLPDRTDKPSFESLVMESIILCPHGGEHGHPPFYAQVRAERGQLGESAERPMMIQALGRVRVDHESDAEGQ